LEPSQKTEKPGTTFGGPGFSVFCDREGSLQKTHMNDENEMAGRVQVTQFLLFLRRKP